MKKRRFEINGKEESDVRMMTEEIHFVGSEINTVIAMEPAESYGGEKDFYVVEAYGIDMSDERMTFSSFAQLEQFHKQVGAYIDRIKSRGQKTEY